MTVQKGIYRVVYVVPGSVGLFSEQILYSEEDKNKTLKNVAKNKIISKASKNYKIEAKDISIHEINQIRSYSREQSRLDDFLIKL